MTDDNGTSFGMIYPQMWGQSVIEQYRYCKFQIRACFTPIYYVLFCSGEGNGNLPNYVSEKVLDNRRKLVKSARVLLTIDQVSHDNSQMRILNHPFSKRILHCSLSGMMLRIPTTPMKKTSQSPHSTLRNPRHMNTAGM